MIFGKNYNRYYAKYFYLYIIGILALLVVDYTGSVIPPKIIGEIIDHLDFGTMDQHFLVQSILSLVAIMIVNFLCRFLWRIGFFGVSYRVSADLRRRLFAKSLTLSQTFYSDNKVGGLMSYYINDVDSLNESFGWGTMMIFDTLFLIPMVVINMFKTNVPVTLFSLIPLALIAASSAIVGKFMEKKYKDRQDAFEELSDFTQESISGVRVIKAFVREAKELKDFSKKNKHNEETNMSFIKLSVFFNVFIDAFIWSIYFLVIIVGSYFVLNAGSDHAISVGELTKLVSYFDNLIWPMFAIGEIINIRSRGKASAKRIDSILNAEVDLIDEENPVKVDDFKGDITFNHLSFKYPDSKDIYALNDISFDVHAGEFIGIIGKTGSSKTTLVNLLLRLYNVERGQILIDGNDIMDYSIRELREKIGYVPQDNFLYSTSIESNIAFSSIMPDRSKVEREATIAGVHKDIIGFPQGYQTILGERGVSVSGGQKQRISIARALYKEPSILILDDSLSAVDTKTEKEILDYLKEERKGKTTILIAHRISSIKDADKILVLDNGGTVSGFDTHDNLLATNEIYRETYSLQKLEEEGGVEHV